MSVCVCVHLCGQSRAWGKCSTGTFFSEGLILKMCLCGVSNTQGISPICWNFNICSASVFILFWNSTHFLRKKIAEIYVVCWVILVETKRLVWQRKGDPFYPFLSILCILLPTEFPPPSLSSFLSTARPPEPESGHSMARSSGPPAGAAAGSVCAAG